MQLSHRLRMLRMEKGLSLEQLQERTGIDARALKSYEEDVYDPSYEVLGLLADEYGVSVDYMLGRRAAKQIDVTGLTTRQIALLGELVSEMRHR